MKRDSLDCTLIQHINLYLARMSDFPTINAEYIRYFGSEPPSRACVGVHLDAQAGQVCRLEAIGWDDQGEERSRRTGLHVQGMSYWAPANIGPYSQGVVVSRKGEDVISLELGRSLSRVHVGKQPIDDRRADPALTADSHVQNSTGRHLRRGARTAACSPDHRGDGRLAQGGSWMDRSRLDRRRRRVVCR